MFSYHLKLEFVVRRGIPTVNNPLCAASPRSAIIVKLSVCLQSILSILKISRIHKSLRILKWKVASSRSRQSKKKDSCVLRWQCREVLQEHWRQWCRWGRWQHPANSNQVRVKRWKTTHQDRRQKSLSDEWIFGFRGQLESCPASVRTLEMQCGPSEYHHRLALQHRLLRLYNDNTARPRQTTTTDDNDDLSSPSVIISRHRHKHNIHYCGPLCITRQKGCRTLCLETQTVTDAVTLSETAFCDRTQLTHPHPTLTLTLTHTHTFRPLLSQIAQSQLEVKFWKPNKQIQSLTDTCIAV